MGANRFFAILRTFSNFADFQLKNFWVSGGSFSACFRIKAFHIYRGTLLKERVSDKSIGCHVLWFLREVTSTRCHNCFLRVENNFSGKSVWWKYWIFFRALTDFFRTVGEKIPTSLSKVCSTGSEERFEENFVLWKSLHFFTQLRTLTKNISDFQRKFLARLSNFHHTFRAEKFEEKNVFFLEKCIF